MKSAFLSGICLALVFVGMAHGDVVINEIMYHPSSENDAEEYIELYNTGAAAVDVSGWQFTSGVAYTLPANKVIPANGYLVVAANAAAFSAKYPTVKNYVAGWSGKLSNSSNKITLVDASGTQRDQVKYTDDYDWSNRQKDVVLDYGHRGWGWVSGADGGGRSLELINPLFDNITGQNWAASTTAQGTPGAPNSVLAADIAPVILNAAHFPLVPRSTDLVTVTAQVIDDGNAVNTVLVHYRNDGAASFNTAPMYDDGAHGDALAGDGVYGATLPVQANGTIVEFYFEAQDGTGHTRFWPKTALDENGAPTQNANCLYQVDDTVYSGAQPLYRIVMRAVDRAELTQINTNSPVVSGVDQTSSHAKMNSTFISFDGTGSQLRYLAGTRNRGHGSRSEQPQSLNVAFTNQVTWNGITSTNLNTQNTPFQLFGSVLYRQAGLAGPDSRVVQVRVNAVNPTSSPAAPAFGFYCCNEVEDSDFADHHFPLDSSGNIYRGQRIDSTNGGADLRNQSNNTNPALADPTPYRVNYFKDTNASEDKWADLIGLTQVLSKGHAATNYTATYDADFVPAMQSVADVNEWMRFFAVNALADNEETTITAGDGDDYYLYFGETDPRAKFVPYDLDTLFTRSDTTHQPGSATANSIFKLSYSDLSGNPPTPLHPLLLNPQFAPIFFQELVRGINGVFAPATFNALADQTLGAFVDAATIQNIKAYNQQRVAFVSAQLPLSLGGIAASTTAGVALTTTNGYPRSVAATCNLAGKANCTQTFSVRVNGVAATYTPWKVTATSPFTTSVGDWSATGVALSPGINKVLVQAFNQNGVEFERTTFDVWYDDSTVVAASGTLAANTTWTAAGGPYRVAANLVVPTGVTLTIQPGATVYVASGATIQVNGTGVLNAVGTSTQRIAFAHEPGATGTTWGSLDFINSTAVSTLSYVTFTDSAGTNIDGHTAQVHVNNASVFFDNLLFSPTTLTQYISTDAASFIIQNSTFPSYPGTTGPELLHGVNGIPTGGYGIWRDNYFGHTHGYNDTIDFTGGNRPGPILQVIGNVFDGTSDDGLDLDSTDAWIEGNVFLHVHREAGTSAPTLDTASAISGGVDTVGQNSDWTIINNIFYDVDHVFLNKGNSTTTGNGGGRIAFFYNTVMHVALESSSSTAAEIAAFDWSDDNTALPDPSIGSGMYAAYNIIYDCSTLHRFYDPAHITVQMDNNLLSVPWTGPGSGNQVVDPRLNVGALAGTAVANVTAAQARLAARLLPGSPAIGTGFGGRNLGALSPHGIAISGEPVGTTNSTSATLTLGPGGTFTWGSTAAQPFGWTAYKWKLDNGPWSGEIVVGNPPPFSTPATISLTGLANGTHTVYVTGKNDAGYYQDDTFVYPATSSVPAAVTASKSWTVDTTSTPPAGQPLVRINEVLAKNTETLGFSGTFPDLYELANAGTATADLSGWGLTDNASIPYKYTIPAGTTLAPGAVLVFYGGSSSSVPQPRTGFSSKDTGDSLTLTRSVAAGGGTADSVSFGAQLPDYSIGRRTTDGGWDLCVPTFGTANVVAAQATVGSVKINEWLASAQTLFATDFIELYNAASLPVNIGNAYLTDNPEDWPNRDQLRQLTFLPPAGFGLFKADGDTSQGPDHLDFKLDATQGEIGFFDPSLNPVDEVIYGPQSIDVSQGRSPNGGPAIVTFTQPTPGGPNPGTTGSTTTTTTNLIPANQTWKYYAATAAPANDAAGRAFSAAAYTDTAWASGAQLLYIETAALTNTEGFVKTTVLPGLGTAKPYQTCYFRTHFNYSGPLTGVTLTAKIMVDDGCILYLNGQELIPTNTGVRIGMPTGTVTYTTLANRLVSDAAVESFVLPASALVAGDNVLAVEVHQDVLQSGSSPSSDVTWGMKLDATVTTTAAVSPVVINEVLALNATQTNPDGSLAGWIELYNPSSAATDLSGMSLSNDVTAPRRFVLPAGTSLPAYGYTVIYCNPSVAASATNAGFALGGAGGGVYFFDAPTVGGGLRDSVVYGRQLPDFSVGRSPNGSGAFTLNVPTFGALNSAAGLASATAIKINEWLAAPRFGSSWMELYNTAAQPVLIGGNYLTDQLTNRTKFAIPPLTYVAGSGVGRWYQIITDNDGSATPGHVNFSLNATGEALGLFTAAGTQLDAISFGAQTTAVSQGRYTDGTGNLVSMAPTPGAANVSPSLDSDGDGIPDIWELAYGLNPYDASDASKDADGDGQSNLAEYLAGTNPNDGTDALRATIVPGATAGQFVVSFTAVAGRTYTIRYKNALTDPAWTTLTQVPAGGTTGVVQMTDTTAPGHPQRFYQVVTPQQP